jgi:GWxTD domain-containing protein
LIQHISQKKRWSYFLLLALLGPPQPAWSAKQPPVPQRYAHWLNKEVNYLITNEEKTQFLHLTSDAEREKFIDNFWNVRNPSVDAPSNTFKEEYYRRIEYANEHFGSRSFEDGEGTDQGMVYITLGAPAQIQSYHESRHLRPIEIWFYENTSGALPVHFYVLFYKPSPIEEYRLYSPTGDRPQKLINGTDAVNNDPVAIKIINEDLGVEAAHVAISLIPGEPVDLKAPTPSMQSDVLLSNIRNYWNLPINKELVRQRHESLVSHRIILGDQFSSLTTFVSRASANQVSLHYLFRFRNPGDLGLAQQADGRYYYSFSMVARLIGPDGKEIYKDVRKISDYLSSRRFDEVKQMTFGVEGRLPIAPGKYDLRLSLTNEVSKQVFQQSRAVLVPGFDHPLGISPVFFAGTSQPQSDPSGELPFSISGVKLAPIGSDNASIAQGDPLRIIFQLWGLPVLPQRSKERRLRSII